CGALIVAGDTIEIDALMRDPRTMQRVEVVPERRELIGGEGRVGFGELGADRSNRDQRIAVVGDARRHDGWNVRAGLLGKQRHEPFVFGVFNAAQSKATGIPAVPNASPDVGREFAVPRVASVDLDPYGPTRVVAEQHADPVTSDPNEVQV